MNRHQKPLLAVALSAPWTAMVFAHGPDAALHSSLQHYLTSPDHVALILAAATCVVVLLRALLPRRAKQRAGSGKTARRA